MRLIGRQCPDGDCSADALLLILLRFDANLAQLLGELRRNRDSIAALV